MKRMPRYGFTCAIVGSLLLTGGCRREPAGGGSVSSDSDRASSPPPGSPAPSVSAAPASRTRTDAEGEDTLPLEGLTLTIPSGWGPPAVQTGQFATKTILPLPGAGGSADGSVEITHFPGMKGMDEQNLQRWMASVTRDDGTPHTRDSAQVTVSQLGAVQLTTVDMAGTVRVGMFGDPGGNPNHRMIAAIVDHPRGPHFVKAVGESATMAKWAQSIDGFLNSATVTGD